MGIHKKTSKLARGLVFALQCALVWGLLEFALMLFGAGGGETRILPYQELALPLFHEQGGARFAANEARLGTQVFDAKKLPGLTRVFVLGGSSVRGLGYGPNASFPAYLERVLEREGYPGRRFEVVNCGIVGISSDQERDMCADIVARYDPDLVMVCSGNNEFLELHARLYHELHRSALRAALDGTVGRLRTFRVVKGLLEKPRIVLGPDASEGVQLTATEFIAEVDVTRELYDERVAHYRQNLEAIARTCHDAGVPLVLMTTPANLRWNDPRPDGRFEAELLEKWGVARELWPEEGPDRSRFVLAALDERRADASMDAFELAFLRGKCLEALGRIDEARAAYVEAMDLDQRYRRTTSAFNRAVVEIAQESGVPLVETRAACEALEAIPAYRSFYDHIHFTPEGALNVAVFVAERLREWRLFDPAPESPSELEAFQQRVLAELDERARAGEDFPEHDRWIGFNFDAGMLAARDLWKYDIGVRNLAASVREDAPAPLPDVRRGKALTYLGNALAFEVGRGDQASRAYRRALELVPEWGDVLRANLAALEERAAPVQ